MSCWGWWAALAEILWGTGTGEAFGVWSGAGRDSDRRSRSSVRSPLAPSPPTAVLVVMVEAGRSRL